VRVTANLGTGTPTTTKTVDIAGTVKMRAVKLAQQTGPFAAGTQILQNRVINWQFGATHVPNCATDHLHSSVAGGIFIDTFGPFIDPFPMGCGFGEVILVTLPPVP
jgi:hypothetical protein